MIDSPRDHELERLRERYHENREGRIFAPLADCHRKRGELDEALRICRKGLLAHPEYSSAHVILAKIHLDREETAEAEAAFDRVLELDPQNLLALAHLGRLADAGQRPEMAVEYWQRLLEIDPEHAEAQERLAADQVEDVAEADWIAEDEDDEERAEVDPPESAEVVADAPSQAQVEAEPGPEEPAAPEPEPAAAPVKRGSAASIATTTLADIYYQQGFKAKSLAIYERLLAAGDADDLVAEKVRRIREEMARIESDLTGAAEPKLATRPSTGTATEAVLSARFVDEAPHGEDASDKPPADPEAAEKDFTQFRSWLDKVK